MGRLQGLPCQALGCQKAPQMLEIVSIGDPGVRRVVSGVEMSQKRADHWDGLSEIIEEFNFEAAIISSASLNRHSNFSLSLRKMDVIMVKEAEETEVPVASAMLSGVPSGRSRHQRGVSP